MKEGRRESTSSDQFNNFSLSGRKNTNHEIAEGTTTMATRTASQ